VVTRQFLAVSLAGVDEHHLLGPELVLQLLGGGLDVLAHRGRVEGASARENLGQRLAR